MVWVRSRCLLALDARWLRLDLLLRILKGVGFGRRPFCCERVNHVRSLQLRRRKFVVNFRLMQAF